ncbi:unnamed protein product [Closterium sp. NIES-64]|nr:unnamed protein product [Closterium sp. NIES-64]CAI5956991.1 unnamed protein product [Closterium sp. NIES-65]
MPAEAFVGIDDNQPTCAEPGEDPLAREPLPRDAAVMWEAPANMQQVYDDSNPASHEAHRTARAACEMLFGYVRATCISPRDLYALFDIRNPIVVARMERASPALDHNNAPPPAVTHADTPSPETPRRRGRVLPAWMHVPTPDRVAQTARHQELIDAGAPAIMSGYLAAAEWMRLCRSRWTLVTLFIEGGGMVEGFERPASSPGQAGELGSGRLSAARVALACRGLGAQ